ncbi:MAG TPA: M48 family metalloprotease [Nitrospirota bacterium]|nr:M48 family metalloprotease [Nitrospirota bacterium]
MEGVKRYRSQELEADRVGLVLMAKAGYGPTEAVKYYKSSPPS